MKHLFLFGDIGENFDSTCLPFLQAAGGKQACIAVIGLGGPTWDSYFTRVFKERWSRLGVKDVFSIAPDASMAFTEENLQVLRTCTALLVCGGDTRRYKQAYVDNDLIRNIILERYNSGVPYAGVSAGALISVNPCIVWGNAVATETNTYVVRCVPNLSDKHALVTGEGLGLLTNCLIEPHFSEFGGFPRLVAAMEKTGVSRGVGIDEPICLEIIDQGKVTVHGTGRCYWLQAQQERDYKIHIFEPGEMFSLEEIQ